MPSIISEMIQLHVYRVIDDGHVEYLLLRRADDELVYPGLWQMVTGQIEENETAYNAVLRELHEETNLSPKELFTVPFISSFYDYRKDTIQLIPVFAASVQSDSQVRLSHEHSEYEWLGFEEALERLFIPKHKQGLITLHDIINTGTQIHLLHNIMDQ